MTIDSKIKKLISEGKSDTEILNSLKEEDFYDLSWREDAADVISWDLEHLVPELSNKIMESLLNSIDESQVLEEYRNYPEVQGQIKKYFTKVANDIIKKLEEAYKVYI